MNEFKKEFITFCRRVVSLHVIVYFLAGIFALLCLNYEELFSNETTSLLMRPVDSPIVAAGPGLQIINGFMMSLYLFPFKTIFIAGKRSWLKLFFLLLGFSIFSPQSPTFGSLEGIIYTKIPIWNHLLSIPECLIYSILFSVLLFAWYKRPKKAWNILSVIAVMLIVLASVAGVLAAIGALGSN
ncbi:MAG: hypothetical protein PHH77_08040 [Victivallaceae bacterium]|jgi:hypothetical protein|nr:hypothetical protein [Victivallaceae bacterium]